MTNALMLLAQAGEDIRGLRGPIEIPEPWPWLPVAAAAVALTGLGLWLAHRWMRRAKPAQTLQERALEALDAARSWSEAGRPREFAIAVSDAVRRYLEERFALAATQRTTDEFVASLQTDPPAALSPYREELAEFLACADLAKFAADRLSAREMGAMLEAARRLVEETAAEREQAIETTPSEAAPQPQEALA